MSYIPKYILKRMFPKDCVKKVDNGVEIKMINVISPLSIDEGIPDDPWNYIDAIIDGKPLDEDKKKKITLKFEGKEYVVEKAKEFEGVVIPVGGSVIIFIPIELSQGEEHDFDITIKTDNPFHIKIKRAVN
ncbi:MAG: hypothetical protein ACTSU2_05830 [Promethearchaeota archaeon]